MLRADEDDAAERLILMLLCAMLWLPIEDRALLQRRLFAVLALPWNGDLPVMLVLSWLPPPRLVILVWVCVAASVGRPFLSFFLLGG